MSRVVDRWRGIAVSRPVVHRNASRTMGRGDGGAGNRADDAADNGSVRSTHRVTDDRAGAGSQHGACDGIPSHRCTRKTERHDPDQATRKQRTATQFANFPSY